MDWPPAYTHTKRVTAGSLCVTVNVACKEACPNSLNVSLGGVPVRVLVKVMLGGRLSRSRTVVSMVPSPFWSILTIQPSLQELPQLVASAGLRGQSSATRLNLMASLRVCEILASRSLAVDTVLSFAQISRKLGAAMDKRMASTATATSNSIKVSPSVALGWLCYISSSNPSSRASLRLCV